MKNPGRFLSFALLLYALIGCDVAEESSLKFEISIDESLHSEVLDGRLLLLISNNDDNEPRFQINDGPSTQIVYGKDLDELKPGETITFTGQEFGYPIENMADIEKGEYFVQAFIHKYSTFNLSNGNSLKLPASWEAGQRWNREPGNIYSSPMKVSIDPSEGGNFSININQLIPPVEKPEDSKYIKHIQIESKLLSEFWGRPMYLGAHVLLPEGFDENPDAQYPLMVFHGHFPTDFGGFRMDPPDPNLEPDSSARFSLKGYNKIVQQESYDFYQQWTSEDFPRFLAIEVQHANPYYDDSYAVNSANLGPYGDAITYELIPYIEEQFRGIGEGWARFLYGGSTGGWEALAVQVKYPDEYNACFAACPDPIDFEAYCLVNIYEDDNAYVYPGDNKLVERPAHRDYLGHVNSTMRQANHKELALATKTRSGQQWDIWEAVYSPVGEDGYPARLWDKYTGEINHEVAEYWRQNYDLRYILERDWDKLGPKLQGKIHLYCGDMDNYYLNNAVYLMEDFLQNRTDPYYAGEVDYGDRAEHCWNGDQENPNAISRLRYNTMYLPKIKKRIEATAPEGAKLVNWK
jgi:hypothetical protein